METKEEVELVKRALEHYKNRLEAFKRKKIKDNAFHSSMFPDIDKEIQQISNLAPKVSVNFGYIGSKGRLMARALEIYKKDLTTIQNETEKSFPEIEKREIGKLLAWIEDVKREL